MWRIYQRSYNCTTANWLPLWVCIAGTKFSDARLQVYPKEQTMQRRLDLVMQTGMADFAMDLYKEFHETEDVPASFLEKRKQVSIGMSLIQY